MPPRRTLLDDDEDVPMAGAPAVPAVAAPDPIALDFGAPPETLFQQLVRHWLNERHSPDILPVQADVLGALLDHIRRQVRYFCFSLTWEVVAVRILLLAFSADGYGPGVARGPRLVRGRAHADHARSDRSRTRQVCRALLYPYTVIQGMYIHLSQRSVCLVDNSDLIKIERFARYIVATPELQEKLSQAELDHAKRCASLFCCHSRGITGGFAVGFVIQVLSVDREPLSCISPAIFTSSSTRARR